MDHIIIYLVGKIYVFFFYGDFKETCWTSQHNKIWTLTRKVNKIWTLARKVNNITLKLNPNMSHSCEGGILILQSYLKEDFCPS